MIQYLYAANVIVLEKERAFVALSKPLLEDCYRFDSARRSDAKKLYLFKLLPSLVLVKVIAHAWALRSLLVLVNNK